MKLLKSTLINWLLNNKNGTESRLEKLTLLNWAYDRAIGLCLNRRQEIKNNNFFETNHHTSRENKRSDIEHDWDLWPKSKCNYETIIYLSVRVGRARSKNKTTEEEGPHFIPMYEDKSQGCRLSQK